MVNPRNHHRSDRDHRDDRHSDRYGRCNECNHSTSRCKCASKCCSEPERSERIVVNGCLPEPECQECPTDSLRFFKILKCIKACELLAQPLLTIRSCDGAWHFPNEPDARFTFWFIISQCNELILVMPECSMKSLPVGSKYRLVVETDC